MCFRVLVRQPSLNRGGLMKCVRCNKDAKKQDRDNNRGCCPSCQHPFVMEPATDGFTDMAIKSAENIVSNNGTFYFSKAQLKYQLHRKLKKKARLSQIITLIILLVFIGLLFKIGFGIFAGFVGFAFFIGLINSFANKNSFNKLDNLIDKWVRINPHEKLLNEARYQTSLGRSSSSNLDDISFERVLICDRNETVDFFLSNLFHFHYACPVLGGNNYPAVICEDMLRRLKQNPHLKVFLIHDYSPDGRAFVRRIKTDPQWFGGTQRYNIIDLGLNGDQKKLFSAMTIKKNSAEVAEMALFHPATLMALCGAAINEGVPLDLVSSAAAADRNDGYG